MENTVFTITLSQIVWICAGIATIIGAFKAIKSINPYSKIKEKMDRHDKCLDNDNKRLQSMEAMNKVICKSLLAIVNHNITGNGVEAMKDVRDELQQALINT